MHTATFWPEAQTFNTPAKLNVISTGVLGEYTFGLGSAIGSLVWDGSGYVVTLGVLTGTGKILSFPNGDITIV
jgi:hypothetical protein